MIRLYDRKKTVCAGFAGLYIAEKEGERFVAVLHCVPAGVHGC